MKLDSGDAQTLGPATSGYAQIMPMQPKWYAVYYWAFQSSFMSFVVNFAKASGILIPLYYFLKKFI
jgi:hypothetical protein